MGLPLFFPEGWKLAKLEDLWTGSLKIKILIFEDLKTALSFFPWISDASVWRSELKTEYLKCKDSKYAFMWREPLMSCLQQFCNVSLLNFETFQRQFSSLWFCWFYKLWNSWRIIEIFSLWYLNFQLSTAMATVDNTINKPTKDAAACISTVCFWYMKQ